jgi:nephrocystin-3
MAEPLMAPESREIRVFLSSTFRDFNEERRLLATQVFPELNRKARDRGVELVEVDLRWGVTQAQAEDGHALEICLQEIERCKRYFIGMLGDSYGSLTPPERQLLAAAPSLLEQRQWLAGRIGQSSYTELEIEQRLQEMGGGASDGRAFFYFRDASYSNPKADAGELGWRSDDPAERQKLELLKQRIRNSGYPLVEEGLDTPQAIADRIKADLWALIDQQFPEGEQPDALQKEARKHDDYRRSRTGAGQYIGGQAYIQELERWLEAGEQQILITGESGAGKSALIANWIEAHQQNHPDDVIYAHHLGCTNDANALRPLLGRLIETASTQLLDAEVITEPQAVPEDWWELVARVAETLQSLGRWCEGKGKRWIWVLDGLDRLDPEDQNALPWLPQNLPAGVQVVASALACPARSILTERSYTTLTIEPLGRQEQEQLIQRYLQRYTKELDGGLRQQILNHHLAGSPLFLKVLLEELRQCGRHDTLKQQLDFYLCSQTIDDLYERVLERLEHDGSGDAVRKVMSAIWASRAGLAETELLAITDLAPLQWAPIDLALEKAFGRNGNRLVFDHDFLRIAVKDRYLPSAEQQRQAHSELAYCYGAQEKWDERKAEELPWQLLEAEQMGDLRALLLDVSQLFELAKERDDREIINYWLAVKGMGDGELDEMIIKPVEEEIQKRKGDSKDLIRFADRIGALLDEAGLYRELLLRLRALSLELEEQRDDRDQARVLVSLSWLAGAFDHAGKYQQAKTLYERCFREREILLGPEHNSTTMAAMNLAGAYINEGNYEMAESLCRRVLDTRERLLGKKHPKTLFTLSKIGYIHDLKDELEKAEEIYEQVLDVHRELLGSSHRNTLTSMRRLASIYRQQDGKHKQAEKLYRQVIAGREEMLGPDNPDTITAIEGLGVLYEEMGEFEAAEKMYQRVLNYRQRILGAKHPLVFTALLNLADISKEKADAGNAESLYRQCIEGRESAFGADHIKTNVARYRFALFLSKQGRFTESIALRRRELACCRERYGDTDPGTLSSINGLAADLRKNGELIESEQLYLEALSGRIESLGDEDGDTMSSRYGLARCLSDQERYADAIPLRRRELAWCREQNGDTDPGTLTSINGLAADLRKNGELIESEQLYLEALSGRIESLGDEDGDTMSSRYGLARCLSDQERHAEAIPLRRRELAWCREQNGDTDPGTLTSINGLAIDLRETGALEEAEALFRELVAARQQVLEPGDFQTSRALGGLAKTLELAGKMEEALAYRQQALDHRESHEGPDAWWTNRERLDLARVLHKLGDNPEAAARLQELQASMARSNEPDDDNRKLISEAEELLMAVQGEAPE